MKKNSIIFFAIALILAIISGCSYKEERKIIADDIFKIIENGKLIDADFALGTPLEKVKEKLGNPIKTGGYQGSVVLSYMNLRYFFDRQNQELLRMDVITDRIDFYGIKVGMKPEDVKRILGDPSKEYKSYTDEWHIFYQRGDYTLFFVSMNETSPIIYYGIGKYSKL